MTVAERKAICEMLVRMERQKDFSEKIGLANTSIFYQEKDIDKTKVKVK